MKRNGDIDAVWDEWMEMVEGRKRQEANAAELLKQHKIIVSGADSDYPTYYMLHPSTVIPDGWQVTLYDPSGPFTHAESKDQDKAITDAFDSMTPGLVRPVSEAEFMRLTQTPRFQLGVRRNTYIALTNALSYEFGRSEEAREALKAASKKQDIEEAIATLLSTLERLRRMKKNPEETPPLFHVTYLFALPGIQARGLVPGSGSTFRGAYTEYSTGKLFVTDADGVSFWASRLEDHANANTDNPEEGWVPVILWIDAPLDDLEEDKVGSKDSGSYAGFVRSPIPPDAIWVWTSDGWEGIELVDIEGMYGEMMDAASLESDDDDSDPWYVMDFDVFLADADELLAAML
jgi:hypothetical protein